MSAGIIIYSNIQYIILFSVLTLDPHGRSCMRWNNWPGTPPHPHKPSTGGGNRTFLLLARATEEMEQYTSEITRGGYHSDGFYWSCQCWSCEDGGWNTEIPFCLCAVKNDNNHSCLLSLSHVWKMVFYLSRNPIYLSVQNNRRNFIFYFF